MKKERLHVLMIMEAEIATTHLISQVLSAAAGFGVKVTKRFVHELRIADFKPDVLPLFIRCGDPASAFWGGLLTRRRWPFIYYVDDDFWSMPSGTPLGDYYAHPMVRDSLDLFVRNAALVITNSAVLAARLAPLSRQVQLLPTFFDFSLLKGLTPESTSEFRIGFAGSSSRQPDLDLVAPVIRPILAEFPQVVFEFAGAMPSGFSPEPRIRFFPPIASYKEFLEFKISRNWQIGLAPLLDTVANRSKTDNKYREYAACGIAAIYSDIAPYRSVIVHGQNGLIASEAASQWMDHLRLLIVDKQTRKRVVEEAISDVRNRYDIVQVSSVWARTFHQYQKQFSNAKRQPLTHFNIFGDYQVERFRSAYLRLMFKFQREGLAGICSAAWRRMLARLPYRFK